MTTTNTISTTHFSTSKTTELQALYEPTPHMLPTAHRRQTTPLPRSMQKVHVTFIGAILPSTSINRLTPMSDLLLYVAKHLGKPIDQVGLTIGTHCVHGSQGRRMELPVCEFGFCGYAQMVTVDLDRLRGGNPTDAFLRMWEAQAATTLSTRRRNGQYIESTIVATQKLHEHLILEMHNVFMLNNMSCDAHCEFLRTHPEIKKAALKHHARTSHYTCGNWARGHYGLE